MTGKITEFEAHMLDDEWTAYPMCFFFRFSFEGQIQESVLRESAEKVLPFHPLFKSTIIGRGNRRRWKLIEDLDPGEWWQTRPLSEMQPGRCQYQPIDLRHTNGLKITCFDGPQTSLEIQGHHACADGLGVFRFFQDWFNQINHQTCETWPIPNFANPHVLRLRKIWTKKWGKRLKILWNLRIGIKGAKQFFSRTPFNLSGSVLNIEQPAASTLGRFESVTIDIATRQKMIDESKRCRISFNDLLLRNLFLTLKKTHGSNLVDEHKQDKYYRVAVPMNLRKEFHQELPACNLVSMIFIDRNLEQLRDIPRLADKINWEMNLIKDNDLAYTMLISMRLMQWMPERMRLKSRSSECKSSMVLSNLGRECFSGAKSAESGNEFQLAGNRLESLAILPNLRPGNDIALSYIQDDERTWITAHYRPDCPLDAGKFLRTYRDSFQSDNAGMISESRDL